MKDFLIALIVAMLLIVAVFFGFTMYRVYFVYPAQSIGSDGCAINYSPIEP